MPKSITVRQTISPDEKESICRELLSVLPEWKESAERTDEIAVRCRSIPVWAAYDEGTPCGFIAMRETSPHAAEIFAMSVKPEYQRHKLGKEMFISLLNYARRQRYEFLQVKCSAEGSAEEQSADLFYQSLGFRELEVLEISGAGKPCRVYIRSVN